MNENLDVHGFVMGHLAKNMTIDWRFGRQSGLL